MAIDEYYVMHLERLNDEMKVLNKDLCDSNPNPNWKVLNKDLCDHFGHCKGDSPTRNPNS